MIVKRVRFFLKMDFRLDGWMLDDDETATYAISLSRRCSLVERVDPGRSRIAAESSVAESSKIGLPGNG